MLNEYFKLTRADETPDRGFDDPIEYQAGPRILVNLGQALTSEPVFPGDEKSPTTIAFDTSEVIVMETVAEIEEGIAVRMIEEWRANAAR